MASTPGIEILNKARNGKYAVGSFNVFNLETIQAVLDAAIEGKSPVFFAFSEEAIVYAGIQNILALIKVAEKETSVPFCLHLDHGTKLKVIEKCINSGFTSVMFDGSYLSFKRNVNLTKNITQLAHSRGVSVEGELGKIGEATTVSKKNDNSLLTDPILAKKFVEETNIDYIAVSIGTSHGAYKFKGKPALDFERLRDINAIIDIPLVLHGASKVPKEKIKSMLTSGSKLFGARGIPDNFIKKAINMGICKINIDTDIKLAFTETIRKQLIDKSDIIDPKVYLSKAKNSMKVTVLQKMKIFGSIGKT